VVAVVGDLIKIFAVCCCAPYASDNGANRLTDFSETCDAGPDVCVTPQLVSSWVSADRRRLIWGQEEREGERLHAKHRCSCEGCVIVDLQGGGWERMDWIDLAEDGKEWRAVVNTAMNLQVHKTREVS
jgi:hypothetical protein